MLAGPFVRAASADNPARGLNLFSAIWAAITVGLLAFFSGRLTKSPLAGAAAGVLLAFSFTFWTQAIIAEVYSLHLALVAACLLALSAFAARPTKSRLAIFFALYAIAFGNHLGMILFLVPFTVFLLQVHPRPRELFAPSTILLALVIAAAGALQYAPMFMYVWVVHRRAERVDGSPFGLLARCDQGRLARRNGPGYLVRSAMDPPADVGVGRATAVRHRGPRARGTRRDSRLVAVKALGRIRVARLRDHDGVRAHL
jgi:hypothetical protein